MVRFTARTSRSLGCSGVKVRVATGRVAMTATWVLARVAARISWRAARRPAARLWFTPRRDLVTPGAQVRVEL
jgi:hypothetical protein